MLTEPLWATLDVRKAAAQCQAGQWHMLTAVELADCSGAAGIGSRLAQQAVCAFSRDLEYRSIVAIITTVVNDGTGFLDCQPSRWKACPSRSSSKRARHCSGMMKWPGNCRLAWTDGWSRKSRGTCGRLVEDELILGIPFQLPRHDCKQMGTITAMTDRGTGRGRQSVQGAGATEARQRIDPGATRSWRWHQDNRRGAAACVVPR